MPTQMYRHDPADFREMANLWQLGGVIADPAMDENQRWVRWSIGASLEMGKPDPIAIQESQFQFGVYRHIGLLSLTQVSGSAAYGGVYRRESGGAQATGCRKLCTASSSAGRARPT